MKKFFLLSFFLWLGAHPLHAQNKYMTVSGTVYDAQSGEKLLGAQIFETHSQKGTVTNEFGYFSLTFPARDTAEILVAYTGYQTAVLRLPFTPVKNIEVKLVPGETLDEVVISVQKQSRIDQGVSVSKIELDAKQIEQIPVLLSEPDLIKSIQKLPGVQSGTEGFSSLYVRGGNADQNLILLDDVPLYYINHLGGFVSIFNTEVLNKVTLYKAGFPVKYGERLSSVLDIRTRDGNKKEYHGSYMWGILSWKFTLEGPIKKDTSSFIISARKFPYDIFMYLLTAASTEFTESASYTFYDVNAKINYKISPKDQLYFSWYLGNDAMLLKERDLTYSFKSSIRWGNHMFAAKWARQQGKWFFNTTASWSRYRFRIGFKETDTDNIDPYRFSLVYYSGIHDWRLKTDAEYYINEKNTVKTGIGLTAYVFYPGIIKFRYEENNLSADTLIQNLRYLSTAYYSYASLQTIWNKKWETEAGLRTIIYKTGSKISPAIEPRFHVKYRTGTHSSVKFSYMEVQQTMHLLTSGGLGLPIDMWMPATEMVPPGRSWQVAGGYYRTFGKNTEYDLSIETYYKEMFNLITYKPGANFFRLGFENWEYAVEKNGFGQSYGLEIFVRKKKGTLTGQLSYTWAKSTRKFEEINNGKPYPFRYDRRHTIHWITNYHFDPNKTFSASWSYGSGYPVSMPVGKVYIQYDYLGFPAYIYLEKNAYRMRPYHRLDISYQTTKKKKRGERTWILSIYNVYNRKNPVFYQLSYNQNKILIQQISLFPIIPSFAYIRRF